MAKSISAVLQYMLWALVVIKLIVPFGFESSLSPFVLLAATDSDSPVITQNGGLEDGALPLENTIYTGAAQPETASAMDTAITDKGLAAGQNAPGSAGEKATGTAKPVDWTALALGVWTAGALATGTLMAWLRSSIKRSEEISVNPLTNIIGYAMTSENRLFLR